MTQELNPSANAANPQATAPNGKRKRALLILVAVLVLAAVATLLL